MCEDSLALAVARPGRQCAIELESESLRDVARAPHGRDGEVQEGAEFGYELRRHRSGQVGD
jgi:hypothetical protein